MAYDAHSPASDAVGLLHAVLPEGSDRLAHTLAVGRKAAEVGLALGVEQVDVLVTAAYLHDVGYAEAAARAGMHQLDGALFLKDRGFDADVCRIVAHHTFARVEARNKGLDLDAEFPQPDGDLADLLDVVSFCDLTTSNTGEPVDVADRFAGIYARYVPDDVVARTMREVEPQARELVAAMEARLARTGRPPRTAVS